MIHQRFKDLLFVMLRLATVPNYVTRRYLVPMNGRPIRLNLGAGELYMPGLVNVEANPRKKADLWLDVRNGLPFRDGTVEAIYTAQMVEHFFPDELESFLSHCYRVLKPGGGARIAVPSLRNSIVAYNTGRKEWFGDWPRKSATLGGKITNFLFCDGQHRTAFDYDYMAELLSEIGFTQIAERCPRQSDIFATSELEPVEEPASDLPHLLYLEARK